MSQLAYTQLVYASTFFIGMMLAVLTVWVLHKIVKNYKAGREPFSLNPKWDATRDFIDSIPEKKK
jgi:hypothetical protein